MILQKTKNNVVKFLASEEQKGLWFLQQLNENNTSYNVVFATKLKGEVNTKTLEETFDILIQRHPVLTSKFEYNDNQLYQHTETNGAKGWKINFHNLLDDEDVKQRITNDSKKPFDLSNELPLRVNLYRNSNRDTVLSITAHHIATDLWSLAILVRELTIVYPALEKGNTPDLPPLQATFQEHVENQEALIGSSKGDRTWEYWKRKLSGNLPVLNMPLQKKRPKKLTYNGKVERFHVDEKLNDSLKELAKKEGISYYMLLLTTYSLLLHRYTGQSELLIGVPMAGRIKKQFRNVIGNFVNTVIVKIEINENTTFAGLLKEVRNELIDSMKYQAYPLPLLVKKIQPKRDNSYSPLVQTVFNWEQLPLIDNILQDNDDPDMLHLEVIDIDQQEGQFEISLEMGREIDGNLHGLFKYNTDLYEQEFIASLTNNFIQLLSSIVENPKENVQKLPLMSQLETNEIIDLCSKVSDYEPEFKTLHETFENQVSASANEVAVTFGKDQLTYKVLNEKSNNLAHFLRNHHGVKKGDFIGICTPRSLEMVIGILGILKAGAVYVPLDPKNPKERLDFIVEDSGISTVLVNGTVDLLTKSDHTKMIDLESDWGIIEKESKENIDLGAENIDLAYTIYTSGSTGKPKGVLNNHYNVLRLFKATEQYYDFSSNDCWSFSHSFAFDFSVWEIWGALLYGGKLVVVPYEVSRTPKQFHQLLIDEKVTMLSQTPSAFKQLLNHEITEETPNLTSLRFIVFGGEALDIQSLNPWISRYGDDKPQIINMFGTTETTVHTTFRRIYEADLTSSGSMIGHPIPDMKIYLLDNKMQPVPFGVTGEIYIGGKGLAEKYLNRTELTSERFIKDVFSEDSNARLYKSGDLGQLCKSGDIKYIGRSDNQVKIRGFRIELGEIQNTLSSHSEIKNSVVTVKEINGLGKSIIAYYMLEENKSLTISELRLFMKNYLPEYMVPSLFVEVEEFFLTDNGKLDFSKLPVPTFKRDEKDIVPARNEVELHLIRIWEETFETTPISITDDFFQLGGHSMLAVTLMGKIEKQFDLTLPISMLFENPTIKDLAGAIKNRGEDIESNALVLLQKGKEEKTVFTMHPIGGNIFCYSPLAMAFNNDYNLYALQVPFLYKEGEPHITVEDLATDYINEIKTIQPEGPYHLAGYCFGGLIAYEMANQLTANGEEIATLTLLDTRSPLYDDQEEFDDAILLSWFARDLAIPFGKTLTIDPADLRLCEDVDEMFQLVIKRAKESLILTDDFDAEQLQRFLQVYISNGTALSLYPPKKFSGRINLLRAVDEPLIENIGLLLGWDRIGVGDLQVYDVPGDHTTMMYQPNVEILANAMEQILQEFEDEEGPKLQENLSNTLNLVK